MRVLIIQQKMIGDVLISTILCENIKKKHPNCTIDFIANQNTLAVLENNPFIDNIIIFENNPAQFKYERVIVNDPYSIFINYLTCQII